MKNKNENENVLAIAGSKKSPLILQLNEYEGTKTLDIRKYFVDKKGDLKPTRKGISLGDKKYNIVKNILKENENRIKEWFEDDIETYERVNKHQELAIKTREDAKFDCQQYSIKSENWKSPIFFECAAKGGEDEIVINENHPFCLMLNEMLEKYNHEIQGEVKKIIFSILISFARAKNLFQDIGKINPEELFEIFEFNWGNFLYNYLKE